MKALSLKILRFVSLVLSLTLSLTLNARAEQVRSVQVRSGCCGGGAHVTPDGQPTSLGDSIFRESLPSRSALAAKAASPACGEIASADPHLGCCGGCTCSDTPSEQPQSDLPPNAPSNSRAPVFVSTWVAAGFEIFCRDLLALGERARVRNWAAYKPHGIAPSLRVLHCAFQI